MATAIILIVPEGLLKGSRGCKPVGRMMLKRQDPEGVCHSEDWGTPSGSFLDLS
jgi:hypothetical protein